VPVPNGDGRPTYLGQTFAESDTRALIAEMRKSCIKKGRLGVDQPDAESQFTLD
jgi:hypothetical protein